jgi:hypothetical protein
VLRDGAPVAPAATQVLGGPKEGEPQ